MRNRSRLLLLLAPWLSSVPRDAFTQANTNVPGGGSGREQGEVQVGAGTQGDVTTGSSGTKAKPTDGAAAKKDAGKDAGKDRSTKPAAATKDSTANRNTEGTKK